MLYQLDTEIQLSLEGLEEADSTAPAAVADWRI